MIRHQNSEVSELRIEIRNERIILAGNAKLKIYGQLNCSSGKRMKKVNRVFFKNEAEAKQLGFRPCGTCMRDDYKQWKDGIV